MKNDNHYDYFEARFEALKNQQAIEERRNKTIRFVAAVIDRISYLFFGAIVGAACIWVIKSFWR